MFEAGLVRAARLLTVGVVLLLLPLAGSTVASRANQSNLVVQWNVPITWPGGAHLNWFDLKADPGDPNNLIVCGAKRNAQKNAYFGVLYFSRDGGKSWSRALEDRASTWVSEQSCAFGPDHTAYFISEASKVIDGIPHHSLGTTRIFVSHDAGKTWIETATTHWADYSQSVVARLPRSRRPVLYVFYNSGARGRGSALGYFTVSADGKRLGRRHIVRAMLPDDYQGVYPSSSVALDDGSLAVLYSAGMKSSTRHTVHLAIGVVRLSPGRSLTRVTVATPVYNYAGRVCPSSLSNSLAYDRGHNLLYLAYDSFTAGRCETMITRSRDGGRTWSRPHELLGPRGFHRAKYFPVLAVNKEGILGLLWKGKSRYSPDCWYFSTSADGIHLDNRVLLSRCREDDSLREQYSRYLGTVILGGQKGRPVSVTVLTLRDYLTRIGMAATSDGVFHPVWSTTEDGTDELRTARIYFLRPPRPMHDRRCHRPTLRDVTSKVIVLYGGEERLDHQTHSVFLNLALRNSGVKPLVGPIYIRIRKLESDYGDVRLLNRSPVGGLTADYVDISTATQTQVLAPGKMTSPYLLMFHFTSRKPHVKPGYFLLKFTLRVFCAGQANPLHRQRNPVSSAAPGLSKTVAGSIAMP